ncbi:NADAR family protein [Streptomyces sioyaensis]|uniref:NADAR family protein n=1 Tax=Streptomyces sioyaensis TaxID=67364 RepID=A0A4Q1QNU0_9ACTN|nr:NADAR family protein [Streptomyces sioyaensis]MBM4793206.1 NADAR family protein [Streptomyces sioyaensis]RXS64602.1 NADAR family protein [Streptomyces sioyaensis]
MMHDHTGTTTGEAAGPAADGPRSVDELRGATAAGKHPKYVFFWGHSPRRDGSLGAGCFSQWWPSPFTVDGVHYATAEHWMMAGKARLFGDAEAERRALAARHPRQAKDAGRTVRGFDEETWQRRRFALVVEGSVHKFGQDAALREYLLGTGSRVLVEASPLDRIWGIGLAADEERAADPARWRGLNLLGFALMAARQRLREEAGGHVEGRQS